MDMDPVFSVIVPMYNSLRTIERCLLSIEKQTFSNYEVLIIDNGSTDGCSEIAKDYEKKDGRFRYVYYDESKGPSPARNKGIDISNGEYIAFVDSDDFVEPDHLASLYSAFVDNGADAVFMGYSLVNVSGEVIGTFVPDIELKDLYSDLAMLQMRDMFGYTWIKAFRSDVIADKRFDISVSISEDEIFALDVLYDCERIALVKKPIYNYVFGSSNSLMAKAHDDYCNINQMAFDLWTLMLSGTDAETFLAEFADRRLDVCRYYGFERKLDAKKFFSSLCKCSFWKYCKEETDFLRAVKKGDVSSILRQRRTYLAKVRLSNILRRKSR